MFLSSMTTDAAAQHGHEFSPPRSASPNPQFSLHRSALSAVLAAVSFSKPPAPVADEKEVPSAPVIEAVSAIPKRVVIQDPDTMSNTSEEVMPSRPSSSTASTDLEPKVRQPRSKTIFNLAHPPTPTRNKQKLQVRPRLLLQLHKVGHGSRPKPQYEVIPSMRCPAKFARKFGRIFKAVSRLGPDDVVVMKADSYLPMGDGAHSDDEQDAGEPVGVICVSKNQDGSSRTEICMDDNRVWEVTYMRNGNYELTTVDEHGLQVKVRWVKRKSSTSSLGRKAAPDDRKFNFSTISADTRRHPVCASLVPSRLDILDHYTVPARTETTPLATPMQTPMSEATSYMDSHELVAGEVVQTGDTLRKLIIVSGIFVAFHENWSTAFQYSPESANVPTPDSPTARSHTRTFSMPVSDTASILSSTSSEENRRGRLPQVFRSATGSWSRSSTALPGAPSTISPVPSMPTSRRSNSTGSAGSIYLQRASSKRQRKRGSLPPDLAEADEERNDSDKENSATSTPMRSESILNTPRLVIPPSIPAADEEDEDDKKMSDFGDSPSTSSQNGKPRVRSAYLPPESTRNIWDSGEPDNACKMTRKPRPRPTSMVPLHSGSDSDTKVKRHLSIRRMLHLFKRERDPK